MSRYHISSILAVSLIAATQACSTANAERAAQLAADSARAQGANTAEVARRSDRARAAAVARTHTRSLAEGTTLRLASVTDVTSQKDDAGKAFVARTIAASLNAAGDTVIPMGAELRGRVSVLASAPTPGSNGHLALEFTTVRFGGHDYPIGTRVISMATRSVARGVTVDDAAKVGVGAAAGAIAGRLIGGNGTGAAVGAVAGGTAGVVYANRTKDHDIVLSPGSAIEVALTSAFLRTMATQ